LKALGFSEGSLPFELLVLFLIIKQLQKVKTKRVGIHALTKFIRKGGFNFTAKFAV
jgi:hypothetical protein